MRTLTTLVFTVGITTCAACSSPGAAGPSSNAPTPTGPQRTIIGQVREVNGGPLADVAIYALPTWPKLSTQVTSTAVDGTFRIEQLADHGLSFRVNGYDSRFWFVPQSAKLDATFNLTVKMQPALRLSPASTIASILTPDDLTYSSDQPTDASQEVAGDWASNLLCGPCKLIYASVPQTGGTFRLSWSGETSLTLWAGDSYAASNSGPIAVAIGKPGESELIVPVPAGTGVDTVLVGFDRKKGSSPITSGTIAFKLALETLEPSVIGTQPERTP